MRLAIMIRDVDYRDALVKKLYSFDNNLFLSIVASFISEPSGCVILTDVPPKELDDETLRLLKNRTVFIVNSVNDLRDDCNTVFKYSSIREILSELSLTYNRWRGTASNIDHTSKLITVFSETDAYSADSCRTLARQVIYSRGGSVIILPLSFINDYGTGEQLHTNSLSRLLYSLQSEREYYPESVTYTDSYGISTLLLGNGQNPLAHLDYEELKILISGLSRSFETIIVDASSCFSDEIISVMNQSDNILLFERGRRRTGIEDLIEDELSDRFIRIRLTGGTEDIIAVEDCVNQIYGAENNESIKSRNN